jgi:hypothetical protein
VLPSTGPGRGRGRANPKANWVHPCLTKSEKLSFPLNVSNYPKKNKTKKT